jgi:hypothetical protein
MQSSYYSGALFGMLSAYYGVRQFEQRSTG